VIAYDTIKNEFFEIFDENIPLINPNILYIKVKKNEKNNYKKNDLNVSSFTIKNNSGYFDSDQYFKDFKSVESFSQNSKIEDQIFKEERFNFSKEDISDNSINKKKIIKANKWNNQIISKILLDLIKHLLPFCTIKMNCLS